MRALIGAAILIAIGVAGCDSANTDNRSANAATAKETATATADPTTGGQKGGTLTVGDESWTIMPAIQCSVYPGNVVSIAGHAAGNPELEIVIDWGGPNQARIAESDSGPGWHAIRDTLKVEIDGKAVRGTATFSQFATGTGKTAAGSFEVNC